MKYYLDLYNDGTFELRETETRDTIYTGSLDEIGIEDNDPNWTNKLDDFFQAELGIDPTEWEVG